MELTLSGPPKGSLPTRVVLTSAVGSQFFVLPPTTITHHFLLQHHYLSSRCGVDFP